MDMTKLREQLASRKAALEAVADSAAQAGATVPLDQTRVGRLSRMDAMAQQAVVQATNHRRRRELADIDIALKKIANGSYGRCSECDEYIAEARLLASPSASLCLHCAQQREAR